eukprot:gene10511-7299_t
MSNLKLRRIVLDNVVAVALRCPAAPVRRWAASAAAVLSGSAGHSTPLTWMVSSSAPSSRSMALLHVNEVASGDGKDPPRVVLATRPSRSLVKGLSGAAYNVLLSCLLPPAMFLTFFLGRLRDDASPAAVPVAALYAVTWSGCFAATALYAAAQQAGMSLFFVAARPYHYMINRPESAVFWSPLACRYEVPGAVGSPHPLLRQYPDPHTMRTAAWTRKAKARARRRPSAAPGGSAAGRSYYEVLGVQEKATQQEIKAAYKRLVVETHPDRNPHPEAAQQFEEVRRAYQVLSSPAARHKYDLDGPDADKAEEKRRRVRTALRRLFGGDALFGLVGDVFCGSFGRSLEGLDYTQEELAVEQQRAAERCRDSLAALVASYGTDSEWEASVRRLAASATPGLGSEVLYVTGEAYLWALTYAAELQGQHPATHRCRLQAVIAQVLTREAVHRVQSLYALVRRRDQLQHAVDAAWYWGSGALRASAHASALALLYEPGISTEERLRRRDALVIASKIFMSSGRPYRAATPATVDLLQSFLASFRQP